MVADTCLPNLTVIDSTIEQLGNNVSIIKNVLPEAICCLQICNIVGP